jgi:hypothetical protein
MFDCFLTTINFAAGGAVSYPFTGEGHAAQWSLTSVSDVKAVRVRWLVTSANAIAGHYASRLGFAQSQPVTMGHATAR